MRKLLTVTLFSGLLTLLRMASGFVIAKVVAIYTGPSGIAMLGQVQSLVSALSGITAAPAGTGVVRYTAEYQAAGLDGCAPWWKAALKWIVVLLAVVIPVACIFAKPLAHWVFGDVNYFWLVVMTALALPLSAANTLIASVINGQHQYRRFIGLGMVSVIIATIVMVVLVMEENLKGAMIAAVLFSSISGLVMLVGSVQQPWFRLKYWWGATDSAHLKGIGGYVAMAVTTALTVPVSLLMVRNILIAQVGWEQAGHWQAVWKISEVYLGVITMALSTYFLPKLASLEGAGAILKEIKTTAKIVMPIVLLLAIAVYLLRDVAISLIFTEAFRPARELFAIQLVGDVVKIMSWLYAYPMLSRGATKWFMGSEIAFSIMFVLLAYVFVAKYGVHGANFAYTANYCLYLLFLYKNLKHFSR
ncbi:MAG: O-antigen translocase [Polaromonas sp.]|nr:O-antigen translocase [Polaromonas sp.]